MTEATKARTRDLDRVVELHRRWKAAASGSKERRHARRAFERARAAYLHGEKR